MQDIYSKSTLNQILMIMILRREANYFELGSAVRWKFGQESSHLEI